MDINAALDEIKRKKGLDSDYKLAKALELHAGLISDYRKGKRIPDAYAAARIALALELEPLEFLAEIEAATEKNETRRRFWQDFLSRRRQGACTLVLALLFGASLVAAIAGSEVGRAACAAVLVCWVWRVSYNGRLRKTTLGTI